MVDRPAFLLGRRTYEDFYGVWPNRPDDPFSQALTNASKCVASRTLSEPVWWSNSLLLDGDAADAVADLKQRPVGTLSIFGRGELVTSAMAADLIDEYLLIVHPSCSDRAAVVQFRPLRAAPARGQRDDEHRCRDPRPHAVTRSTGP
jgi:dihydrofolate reductase